MAGAGPHTIVDALFVRAERASGAVAFQEGNDALTWAELLREASVVAGALGALGIERGTRCALALPNGLDFVRAACGTLLRGGAIVALNSRAPAVAIAQRLRAARCAVAVVEENREIEIRAAAESTGIAVTTVPHLHNAGSSTRPPGSAMWPTPEDPAFLQFTSGTTGEPRAAVVRHRNVIWYLNASARRLRITADDVAIGWAPLYHDLGIVRFFFGPFVYGCPGHLVRPSIANLRAWLETTSRVGGTLTGAPDFVYRVATRMVDPAGLDLRRLRVATNGGEPVRLSTIEAFERRFGLDGAVRPGYGLAEATLGVSLVAPGEALKVSSTGDVSCGRPLEECDLRIVGPDDRDAPPGTSGQIVIRGPSVFAGYFDNPRATEEVLKDGWLWTGDQGRLDEEGQLFVQGRTRALIKRGGAGIAPREIEEATESVADVRLSGAIGMRDPAGGDDLLVVVAEVRVEGEARLLTVAEAVARSVLRGTGIPPARVLLAKPRTIPRTANGKIRYDALRESLSKGSFDEAGAILFRWPE